MLNLFQKFGRDLFLSGINASHSGNISIRQGNKIYITRSGAMLGDIQPGDIIECSVEKKPAGIASREILVHRSIYVNTNAKAIMHSHPPYTIVLSFFEDKIIPIDSEGNYFLDTVPVLTAKKTIGSDEVAAKLPGLLNKNGKIAVVKSHGSFAIGENLEKTFLWTSTLEKSAQIIYLTRSLSSYKFRDQLNLMKYKR